MALFPTPFDPRQNSYVSLAEANFINGNRLDTPAWDSAGQSPSATGYLVNDPGASLTLGATTIPLKDGTGNFTQGDTVTFVGDSNTYEVTTDEAEPVTSITISPGLLAVPSDGSAVDRIAPANDREKALIWASSTLDTYMTWQGVATQPATQKLDWPRQGVVNERGYSVDSSTIPEDLKCATSWLAADLLGRNTLATPSLLGNGFNFATIPGPIQVTVDPAQVISKVPTYIISKIAWMGTYGDSSGLLSMMPLGRS